MHKRKNMRSFGGITNKAICWGISAMLGISPMVGIWGVPHAPNVETLPLFGVPNPTKDAGYLGSKPQAPNISDGVYLGECPSPRVFMGSAPCPQVKTQPLFGKSEPNERRKLFGEPTPSPQYLRWHVFGSAQAPGCIWGAPHAPDIIFHF